MNNYKTCMSIPTPTVQIEATFYSNYSISVWKIKIHFPLFLLYRLFFLLYFCSKVTNDLKPTARTHSSLAISVLNPIKCLPGLPFSSHTGDDSFDPSVTTIPAQIISGLQVSIMHRSHSKHHLRESDYDTGVTDSSRLTKHAEENSDTIPNHSSPLLTQN